jgi:hypothetical protein
MKQVGQVRLNPFAPIIEETFDYKGEEQEFTLDIKGKILSPVIIIDSTDKATIKSQTFNSFVVAFEKSGKTKPSGKITVQMIISE